jgi:UDP-glucose 4-epimerase
MLNKQPIRIFGDGEQTRDFVFVKDVAQAIIKAFTAGNNHIYNIGSGQKVSINYLFQQLQQLTKTTVQPEYLPFRPGDIHDSLFDISKVKTDLAWEPSTDLITGLNATIKWFQRTKL